MSLSLLETTAICARAHRQRSSTIERSAETRPGDVRIYVSDCARLGQHTDWRPVARPARRCSTDIFDWVHDNERAVRAALGWRRHGQSPSSPAPAGSIGSESVAHFVRAGFDVIGLENDMRARVLRARRLHAPGHRAAVRAVPGLPLARHRHPRRGRASTACSREHGARDRAGRAHRGAALARLGGARTRSPTSASTRTARSTCSRRRAAHCPDATFVFTSTNKVYGDTPEPAAAGGAGDAAGAAEPTTATSAASTPRCRSTTRCTRCSACRRWPPT